MSHNLPHPECASDEEWFCNVASADMADRIPFETKRLGKRAFRFDDSEIEGDFRPVFVKRAELEAKGYDAEIARRNQMAACGKILERRIATPQTKKGKAMEARNKRVKAEKAKRQAAQAGSARQ